MSTIKNQLGQKNDWTLDQKIIIINDWTPNSQNLVAAHPTPRF